MLVEYNPKSIPASDVAIGDCFAFATMQSNIFIMAAGAWLPPESQNFCVAVDIQTGDINYIDRDIKVVVLDAKVVIGGGDEA